MRALHLIPIVRLATQSEGDAWKKPYADSGADWAKFLNALNWPIENRYVIVFNEPNHANEWGRTIDPEGYAHILVSYAQLLKRASEDFFVLPAGLDVSASSDGRSLDAAVFIQRMLNAEPALFDHLDGWTSHSYPNPAFSGSVFAVGRGTPGRFYGNGSISSNSALPKSFLFSSRKPAGCTAKEYKQIPDCFLPIRLAPILACGCPSLDRSRYCRHYTVCFELPGIALDHFSWKKLGSQGITRSTARINKSGNYPVSPISGRNIRWNTGLCRVLWLPAPPMYFPHCSKMKGRVFCQNREGTIPSNWSQPLRFLRYGSRFRSWSPASTGL